MSKRNKYEYQVTQENDSWAAAITRRATATKTVVSKSQGGFATEAEAQAWGEKELKLFVQNLSERNKRRST